MAESKRLFPNQLPDQLADELAAAERLNVHPSAVGSSDFDQAISKGTVKWAVSEIGELPVIPKFVDGQELSHAVLTEGAPVQTAGEAEIVGSQGQYLMLEINNRSGHYQPTTDSLEVGKQAFRVRGIEPPL